MMKQQMFHNITRISCKLNAAFYFNKLLQKYFFVNRLVKTYISKSGSVLIPEFLLMWELIMLM